jgi:uncharacterized protein (TIGR02001 family)
MLRLLFKNTFITFLFVLLMLPHFGKAATISTSASTPAAPVTKSKVVAPKKSDTDGDNDSDDDDSDDDDDDNSSASEKLVEQGKALSANVTIASDYVLRGLSQTAHQPATQGGFDWEHPSGFYLGVWGSNVRFQDSPATLELDGYGGYTYHFDKKTSLSLGALYYTYWADSNRDSWVIPLKGQWGSFSLETDYSPNWEGSNATSWYFQGGWQDKVIWDVKLGGFLGYSTFSGGNSPDYIDFLVTASREFLQVEWQISGVFVNTDVINGSTGGDRAIFSVTKSF